MYKDDVACINNGMLLSHKKNEIMPFAATWMDLEIFILSEVHQKEKDKCHMISLICGNIKYDANELIYERETDSQIIESLWLSKRRG